VRVFITGGNGFIGSVVARELAMRGHELVLLLRARARTERLAGLAYRRVDGDVRELETLRNGMAGCDAVIHLACTSSWDGIDCPEMKAVVLDGTANVLTAAGRQQRIPRVVFISSVAAIGATKHPTPLDESFAYNLARRSDLAYSLYKHRAEGLCFQAAAAGRPVVIVNPAEVYGPNDTNLVTAGNVLDFAKSSPVLVCHGGTSVAYVDDVALAIVRALERGRSGHRYILGGPNVTWRELAETTLDILGRTKRIVALPNIMIRGFTRVATAAKLKLPYNPKVIPYATRYWFVRSDKATRELGVDFRPLRASLEPTLAWLHRAGHLS